jgi:rifampicin phosphotransferase
MSSTFEAPEPGCWEIENTHLTRPMTRWLGAIYPSAMTRGFRTATKNYGLLLEGFDVAIVNGFVYMCARPVGKPKNAKGTPPKLVFKILSFFHPEIRRRNKRIEEVFATKAWRDDLKRWDETLSVDIRRANQALEDVDLSALDDAGLAAHVAACSAQLDKAVRLHHELNPCAVLPVGDLVVHACEWTGKPTEVILGLLRGSTPVSAGHNAEMKALVAAIASSSEHTAVLDSARPAAEVLDALRDAEGAVGTAMRAWLSAVGHRILFGGDLSDVYALEAPDLLRGVIRAARKNEMKPPATTGGEAAIRDAVPDRHRAQFDELLAEARAVNRLRDERTYHNDMWTLGLTRRALVEAGRRLAKKAKLAHYEHVVDLDPSELAPLLVEGERGKGPSADEVAERVKYRTSRTVADAPAHLGHPPSPPPPADWLPPMQARASRAVEVFIREAFKPARDRPSHESEKDDSATIRGLPASPGLVEARARIVLGPQCFGKIEQGDVLVARTTSPTYNVLLPMLGGIVTDRGGLLSHAAIVAREYGMPAVVGTSDATKRIRDGARVRIDGARGTVEVVT